MNYRRNNLSAQLQKVLTNVETNIRENHLRAVRIGRIGRRDLIQRLLIAEKDKPVKPETELDDDDEIE
jgi:hypothetical protein